MAIQISGTTVIDNSRNLSNITNASTSSSANAFVVRDESGNFSAGTITANLTGTASNASAVPWSGVSGKPTTLSGYGITDAGNGSIKVWGGAYTNGSNYGSGFSSVSYGGDACVVNFTTAFPNTNYTFSGSALLATGNVTVFAWLTARSTTSCTFYGAYSSGTIGVPLTFLITA